MAESEVARVRRQIEEECQAMNLAMTGFAIVGRHKIIAHKYKMLDQYHEELAEMVGKTVALKFVCETYDAVMVGGNSDKDDKKVPST